MHGEGWKRKGSRAKGRSGFFFEFYALLATRFSLRLGLVCPIIAIEMKHIFDHHDLWNQT